MTYEEFTALARRRISIDEYREIVKPVYDYHPAIPNKKTAAKLYDMCGLQVFRDMKGTADCVARLAKEQNRIRTEMDGLCGRLDEIENIVNEMSTATPIAKVKSEDEDG